MRPVFKCLNIHSEVEIYQTEFFQVESAFFIVSGFHGGDYYELSFGIKYCMISQKSTYATEEQIANSESNFSCYADQKIGN
jgi:hypothetical protein